MIYLEPVEQLLLQVIETRRRSRSEERDSPSEIIADALWKYLEEVEKMPRKQLEDLLPVESDVQKKTNLKAFPKASDKVDK